MMLACKGTVSGNSSLLRVASPDMASSLESFPNPSPPRPSVKAPLGHSSIRASSQTEKLESRRGCARHRHYSIHIHPQAKKNSGTSSPHPVPHLGQSGQQHVSTRLAQVQPSRFFQGVLPSRHQLCDLFHRPEEQKTVNAKETSRLLWKKKTKAVHNPSHSRAPLAPCLSFPVMVLSSIFRLGSGDSIKILPKFQRPNFLQNKSASKAKQERVNFSPSASRSPTIQKAVDRYRSQCHEDDKESLTAFLKNAGDHLDDEDNEDEDQLRNPAKATLNFFKMVPRVSEHPHPTRSSSFGSSHSSSSSDSSQKIYSPASQTVSGVASSNQHSCNRAQHLANRHQRGSGLDFLEL
ncbi:hypothetical protein PtB15_12B342 [Puccinia triticina]|nr:hypothetical protein PtB15_12B342 [Puccinia triticina]